MPSEHIQHKSTLASTLLTQLPLLQKNLKKISQLNRCTSL